MRHPAQDATFKPPRRLAVKALIALVLLAPLVAAGGQPFVATSFGGAQSYIDQLTVQLTSCDPTMLIYPPEIGAMCAEASRARERRSSVRRGRVSAETRGGGRVAA